MYIKNKTKKALSLSRHPLINERYPNPKKGESEDLFLNILRRFFGDKIKKNYYLPGSFERQYKPDFVYFDKENNLFIDIEIDEPYVINTGLPIHYINSDDLRDNFFGKNGWLVIRFAEVQVVRQPESCCKVIAEQISQILPKFNFPFALKLENDVTQVPKWSKSEAETMARNNYRNIYLTGK